MPAASLCASSPEEFERLVLRFARRFLLKTKLCFDGIIHVTRRKLEIIAYCRITAIPDTTDAGPRTKTCIPTALFRWTTATLAPSTDPKNPNPELRVPESDPGNPVFVLSNTAKLVLYRALFAQLPDCQQPQQQQPHQQQQEVGLLFPAETLALWLDGEEEQNVLASDVAPHTADCDIDDTPPPRGTPGDQCLCVGDLHGRLTRTLALWINASVYFGPWFEHMDVIFLGDFCDRGEDTRGVLSFLIWLQRTRVGPTHCIAGNHDFAMSSFLRVFPEADCPDHKSTFTSWHGERLFTDPSPQRAHEGMHLQGQRWGATLPSANDSVFEAAATFASYGCTFPDRAALLAALPPAHVQFLRTLPWLVDLRFTFARVIALHAGLENNQDVDPQLDLARTRNCDSAFVEVIAGRRRCRDAHPDLEGTDVVEVSGHFGFLDISHTRRCIVDEGGGRDGCPLAALVLPSRAILRSNQRVQT